MVQAGKYVGKFAASHFKGIKSGLRAVLKVAHLGHRVLGSTCMNAVGKALHSVGLPEWTPAIPRAYDASRKLNPAVVSDHKVVYFPSCINQMMGLEKDTEVTRTQSEVMVELRRRPVGRSCFRRIWMRFAVERYGIARDCLKLQKESFGSLKMPFGLLRIRDVILLYATRAHAFIE